MKLTQLARAAVAGLLAACALVGAAEHAVADRPVADRSVADRSVAAGTRTVALGMDVRKSSGITTQQAVTKAEAGIGHKFAFTRDFLLWDAPFPTSYENWLGARGTTPMISVKSRLTDGTPVKWADVAAAQPGSALYRQMVGWADRIRDFGYPVYFTYNHEPEASGNLDLGTAKDFIAAWRRMHDLFATEGATNAKFMWIMTSWAFQVPSTDRRYGAYWYPGDAYVDGIASDAYNWSDCRYPHGPYQSLAQTISGFVAFGAHHPSVPLWLTEFATVERGAGEKGQWIADAQALLKQPAYAQIVGVSYFDQVQTGVPCYWPIDTSTSSHDAMSAMAQDPFYQGSVDDAVPAPAGNTAFVAAASTTANSTAETVRVPTQVRAGNGLVLIATSGSPDALTAPAGWTTVSTRSSGSMYSAVWQRVARSADAGSTVAVNFGVVTKGSVQVLAYSGTSTSQPVASAVGATQDTSTATLTAPALPAPATGRLVISYWAARTSTDTTLQPRSGLTVRSAETNGGGGRITSASADSSAAKTAGRVASVSPAASHSVSWTVLLTPSS